MKTIKIIFLYLFFGLSFLVRGQAIGNYFSNGSFEVYYECNNHAYPLSNAKDWLSVDSNSYAGEYVSFCNGRVPYNGSGFQHPHTGSSFILATMYAQSPVFGRGYLKNRLKTNLKTGVKYCVKFYISIANESPRGMDGFGIYFSDNSIDTISKCTIPLSFINPQIKNPTGNVISDTLNWTAITGTLIATGSEKYALIGNFLADTAVTTSPIFTQSYPAYLTDVYVDDVSCIEVDLPAYAGKDTTIYLGDSLFIGRQPDFAMDPGCVWYKLPNMTTALDTISGIWVKPTTTSTYVVRQVLDCSPLKWDTVVVTISTNYVSLDKLQNLSDNINLFPNPTSGNLFISGFSASDISSFSISNNLGQNIQSSNFIQKNNSIIIETSELESGLYQIHLKTQYGIVTKKFVKTN